MSIASPQAVVLLSGGLDSATTAAMARAQGFALYALSFQYGQRHSIELQAAAKVARSLEVAAHVVQNIDLRLFGGSALPDAVDVRITTDNTVPALRDMQTGDVITDAQELMDWRRQPTGKHSFAVQLKPHSYRCFRLIHER